MGILDRIFGRPKIDTSYQDFQIEEAQRARAEEEARQARIADGMERIRLIFEGGTFTPPSPPSSDGPKPAPFGGAAAGAPVPAPGRRPFLWEKDAFGNPLIDQWENQQRASQRAAAAVAPAAPATSAASGPAPATETFEGMNPLLAQREKAQMDFYLPQLDNQRADAQKELTFALARAGLLNSTTAGERQGDLAQDFALERGSTLSRIASDIAGRRTWLNQQRAAIEGGLRSSGDQTGAANQALATMSSFAQDQPVMNPLGHLFAGVSEGIGSAQRGAEAERVRRTYGADPMRTQSGRVVGT